MYGYEHPCDYSYNGYDDYEYWYPPPPRYRPPPPSPYGPKRMKNRLPQKRKSSESDQKENSVPNKTSSENSLTNLAPKRAKTGENEEVSVKENELGPETNKILEYINISNPGLPEGLMLPQYCKVCAVSLNAPSQAKQHYTGKTHCKKAKILADRYKKGEISKEDIMKEISTQSLLPNVNTKAEVAGSLPVEPCSHPVTMVSTSTTSATPGSPSDDIYCKICDVSFNSTKQAQQHYAGKNHARRVKIAELNCEAVRIEPAADGKKATYMCTVCQVYATSQDQLNAHLRGAKHAAKLNIRDKPKFIKTSNGFRGPGSKQWWKNGVTRPNGSRSQDLSHNINNNYVHQNRNHPTGTNGKPQPGYTPRNNMNSPRVPTNFTKKYRKEFMNYRTPSGQYYCSTCNVTANSDSQFGQHLESRKHRVGTAISKTGTEIIVE